MSAPDAILASALNACAWVCVSVCFHCMSSSLIYCGRGADCVILQTSKWCRSDDDLPTLQITAQINTGWTLGGCQRKPPQFLHLGVSSLLVCVCLFRRVCKCLNMCHCKFILKCVNMFCALTIAVCVCVCALVCVCVCIAAPVCL